VTDHPPPPARVAAYLLCCLCCVQAENQITAGSRGGRFAGFSDKKKGDEGPLVKICHDVSKLSAEQVKGLSSQVRRGGIEVVEMVVVVNRSRGGVQPGEREWPLPPPPPGGGGGGGG
jgi:hypothetical protein